MILSQLSGNMNSSCDYNPDRYLVGVLFLHIFSKLEITKITENDDKTLITGVTDDKPQTMVSKQGFYQ